MYIFKYSLFLISVFLLMISTNIVAETYLVTSPFLGVQAYSSDSPLSPTAEIGVQSFLSLFKKLHIGFSYGLSKSFNNVTLTSVNTYTLSGLYLLPSQGHHPFYKVFLQPLIKQDSFSKHISYSLGLSVRFFTETKTALTTVEADGSARIGLENFMKVTL
jgi:hypothetical protein